MTGVPDTPLAWTEEPIVIAPAYLRWALAHGTVDGTCRWVLQERDEHGTTWHVLEVKESPTAEDLVAEMAPTTGLPIAEALLVEARRRLPHSVFADP